MHSVASAHFAQIFALCAAVMVIFMGCGGCDSEVDAPPPWKFNSDRAPYRLIFPPEWTQEPAGSINPASDIEASREEKLFFLVIPQELQQFPKPDLLQFKEEGLRSLDESIDDFVVRRRGALELDGVSGLTVFANGKFEDESISYITSYAITDGIGYQIIAFGASEYESKLFEDVDLILSHWQFIDEDEKEESPSTDAAKLYGDTPETGSLPEPDDDNPPSGDKAPEP